MGALPRPTAGIVPAIRATVRRCLITVLRPAWRLNDLPDLSGWRWHPPPVPVVGDGPTSGLLSRLRLSASRVARRRGFVLKCRLSAASFQQHQTWRLHGVRLSRGAPHGRVGILPGPDRLLPSAASGAPLGGLLQRFRAWPPGIGPKAMGETVLEWPVAHRWKKRVQSACVQALVPVATCSRVVAQSARHVLSGPDPQCRSAPGASEAWWGRLR